MQDRYAGDYGKNVSGGDKYSKAVVCSNGCIIFRLTDTPPGNENFLKGGFREYPDET